MNYSEKIKPGILILLISLIVAFSAYPVFGAEGHGSTLPQHTFRINNTEVTLGLDPATYQKDVIPKVLASLKNIKSDAPVYDAELFIYLENENAAAQDYPLTISSPVKENEDAGLDFGDFGTMESVGGTEDLSNFLKMDQQHMAGMYSVHYPLSEKGMYRFTLAVKYFQGQKYVDPLIYGGSISYPEKSNARLHRMLLVVGLIIASGIVGIWIMSQRSTQKLRTSQKMNLLDVPWIGKFIKSSWFQPVFQIPSFIVFIIIIFAGLFDIQTGDRNIATLLMWTIWWSAIIFTFVFIGRIWCMACPIGALQDWITRLKSLNKNYPASLRNIYLSSFLFIALTWWDSYSGIVNRPALTAYLLIGFFAVASGMALIYKGRSFCRYVCPIGGLIGLYSMFSPIELRHHCLEVCRKHGEKECINGTAGSHPCPMLETPMTLDRNNNCNFCGECIKSCSQNNIVVRVRNFGKDIWVSSKGYLDEALLAVGLVGMTLVVTGEMVGPWQIWMDALGKIIPFDTMGITEHSLKEKATFLIVLTLGTMVLPALLLFIASLIVRKITGPSSPVSLKRTFIQFAYMFIPVGLSTHLSHNINHLLLEGPGIVPAFERLAYRLAGSTAEPDWSINPLMGMESIFWLQMFIILTLNIISLYAGYRISVKLYKDKSVKAFIPMAALVIFFMVINVYILGQPMAMRHTH